MRFTGQQSFQEHDVVGGEGWLVNAVDYLSTTDQVREPVGLSVRCRGVVHLYRTFEGHDVVALQGVDLDIEPSERVAFLGPSGSGKSTLMTLLGGIQRPSAGKIFIGEDEISRMSERAVAKVRAQRVSTMLQGATRNLLPYATALQNIAFAKLAMTPRDRRRAPDDTSLLTRMGLQEQARQTVSTMSGGQRQRLALVCAVVSNPQLLLADEPTSQLSHQDRDEVLALIHGLGDDFGTTILVVTHQPEVAATFARTVRMLGGRVGSEGRDGAEYVVVGKDGVLHLPADVAREWPPGTLVRVEPEQRDRVLLTRPTEGRSDGDSS
jgi:ABC-type lipoprotein export system ATPase subunit